MRRAVTALLAGVLSAAAAAAPAAMAETAAANGPPGVDAAAPQTDAMRPTEPDGYRMDAYRAPVPATLHGATVVTTETARALWDEGQTAFIDVLPRPPKPDLPAGTLWRPPVRDNIPGSLWLANTGYGLLADETEAYFKAGLADATNGDRSAPVLFYCQTDCWMSWNAARRAVALGYGAVHWFPEGTDGWAAAGWPLEHAEPAPPGAD